MQTPNLANSQMRTEQQSNHFDRRALLAATISLGFTSVFSTSANAATESRLLPPFKPDRATPVATTNTEVAVVAGGCFWGVQGVYQHVQGVLNAVSGYAGGDKNTATYEVVGSGVSGHAEAVQITYDPRQVSYADILHIFFSVAHDPTQLNRQGPDRGPQYRSAVFPLNEEQARTAKAYIAQLNQSKVFSSSIVTTIEPGRSFYPAEGYHQDFLVRNPTYPYIVINDLPKVADLKSLFPKVYKSVPTLVGSSAK